MNQKVVERDPFNTALAAELTRLVGDDETGIMRLSRLTGIHRSTLRRYLDGDRDIKVATLRKIVAAVPGASIAEVFAEAERSVEQ